MTESYSLDDVRKMGGAESYSLADVQAMSKGGGVLEWAKNDLAAIPGRVGNIAAGFVNGAGRIGATLVDGLRSGADQVQAATPERWRPQVSNDLAATPRGASLRQDITGGLQSFGADHDSIQFKGGDLAAQIAGTAGAPAVLGRVAGAFGAAPRVVQAITSGGFSTGGPTAATFGAKAADMALRSGAGALTGGAMAGMVNPEDAPTGAAIGGSLPFATKMAGEAAQLVARAYRAATTPQEVKVAQQLAQQLGVTADDLKAAMTGPQLIPGYQATVPQIVQNPAASQLQRTLKTAGADALGDAERLQQLQYRDALGRIGPTDVSAQDAANRAGGAIQDFALSAEKAAKAKVRGLFDAIPRDEAMMQLPIPQMQAARSKFLGPATFGEGGGPADQAIEAATAIGTRPVAAPVLDYSSSDLARKAAGGHAHGAAKPVEPVAVAFDDIQKLRSSIGEAINKAGLAGNNQAKAALTVMKDAIDNKVAAVAAGEALPGEVFTPQAIDAWGQALKEHGAKKLQFNTGPQAQIFKQGGDGQAAIQGAEIPGKFFNARRSQVEDVQAFKRLIGNREDLAQEMKRYAIAEGMGTESAAGDLTSKFRAWLKMRTGATGELFNEQELATLNEVGKAVARSMKAENLGRVSNSDTAQKLQSLQQNGLLDNGLVDVLARKIPVVGSFTGPMLDSLRKTATSTRQGTMAGLLADPALMERSLRAGMGGGLLNLEPEALELLSRGAYRTAPVLGVRQ
jgi:hypothetical protein